MKLLVSVSGLFSMYSPPPWSAMPGLPLSAWQDLVARIAFNGGGSPHSAADQE